MIMDDKTIASIDNAFDIIELSIAKDGVKPVEVRRELDFSKSNVHYYLKTLCKYDLLTKRDGKYYVSLGFMEYGGTAVENIQLVDSIDTVIHDLATETEKLALLAVEQNGRTYYIYQIRGSKSAVRGYFVGKARGLHCTAFGKAIFANMSKNQQEKRFETTEFIRHTEKTLVTREELMDEFETIRENDFAYSDGEFDSSLRSLASPIWDKQRENLLGAIGVIGTEDSIDSSRSRVKAQRFAQTDANIVKRMAKTARNKID